MSIHKILVLLTIIITLLINTPVVLAAPLGLGETCNSSNDQCDRAQELFCEPTDPNSDWGECVYDLVENDTCIVGSHPKVDHCRRSLGLECKKSTYNPQFGSCEKAAVPAPPAAPGAPAVTSGVGKIFGIIKPPEAIKDFAGGDPTGAKGIGKFLSNLVSLIYIFAAIALLFMLLWGAFDWITSEGEKEKINAARGKIINAIIGLMLFAVAFAFLRVLGTFTGFKFFVGQDTASLGQVCCARTYTREGDRCYLLKEDGSRFYDNPVARCPDGTYCSSYDPATRQPTCINP